MGGRREARWGEGVRSGAKWGAAGRGGLGISLHFSTYFVCGNLFVPNYCFLFFTCHIPIVQLELHNISRYFLSYHSFPSSAFSFHKFINVQISRIVSTATFTSSYLNV